MGVIWFHIDLTIDCRFSSLWSFWQGILMFQQVTISVGYVSAYGLQKVNSHQVFCSSLFCSYFSRYFFCNVNIHEMAARCMLMLHLTTYLFQIVKHLVNVVHLLPTNSVFPRAISVNTNLQISYVWSINYWCDNPWTNAAFIYWN